MWEPYQEGDRYKQDKYNEDNIKVNVFFFSCLLPFGMPYYFVNTRSDIVGKENCCK